MGKTVLITGASRGIGKSTARLFASKGYNLILNYHTSQNAIDLLTQELKQYGVQVMSVQADVSDSFQVKEMFARVEEWFGGVDILINNAGIARQKLITDITDAEFNEMLGVNLNSVFYCCRAALPHMIYEKSGHIVNVSSIWGVTGASCEVHYSAAKAGVIGLTKALAKEVAPSGVYVNCIAPGVIDTDMCANLSEADKQMLQKEIPLGRLGTPEDIAKSIVFLCEDSSSYFTGQVISPNGGIVI